MSRAKSTTALTLFCGTPLKCCIPCDGKSTTTLPSRRRHGHRPRADLFLFMESSLRMMLNKLATRWVRQVPFTCRRTAQQSSLSTFGFDPPRFFDARDGTVREHVIREVSQPERNHPGLTAHSYGQLCHDRFPWVLRPRGLRTSLFSGMTQRAGAGPANPRYSRVRPQLSGMRAHSETEFSIGASPDQC